jgi:hypothetical protein
MWTVTIFLSEKVIQPASIENRRKPNENENMRVLVHVNTTFFVMLLGFMQYK